MSQTLPAAPRPLDHRLLRTTHNIRKLGLLMAGGNLLGCALCLFIAPLVYAAAMATLPLALLVVVHLRWRRAVGLFRDGVPHDGHAKPARAGFTKVVFTDGERRRFTVLVRGRWKGDLVPVLVDRDDPTARAAVVTPEGLLVGRVRD